jgi:excisionase family DNA binding protein
MNTNLANQPDQIPPCTGHARRGAIGSDPSNPGTALINLQEHGRPATTTRMPTPSGRNIPPACHKHPSPAEDDTGSQPDPPPEDGFITKPEIARRLRISIRTLDHWMREGIVVYYKLGRATRFRWSEVLSHLENRRNSSPRFIRRQPARPGTKQGASDDGARAPWKNHK